MTQILDSKSLDKFLYALAPGHPARVLLVVSSPHVVGAVHREVGGVFDIWTGFRFDGAEPAFEPWTGFDDATLRQELQAAKNRSIPLVIVTVDEEAARKRLAGYLAEGDVVESVQVDTASFEHRPRLQRGDENQETVVPWCDYNYPDERGDLQTKADNAAEEMGELIAAAGLDPERFAERLIRSANRSEIGVRASKEEIEGEVADMQIALYDLASTLGVRVSPALVEKMAKLRKRKPEESKARQDAKAALGL